MNEREIIKLFSTISEQDKKELVLGIGDDCAVLRLNEDKLWLVTTDTLIESVHFDLNWHPPDLLGRKAVAVNVSDIAAMGGLPAFAFLSLGMPRGFSARWLETFAAGLKQACLEYGCTLAGGDTVRTSKDIMITLTVLGEAQPNHVLYRKDATAGDDIWVSGTLGNAAAGLELCRKGMKDDKSVMSLVKAHLDPEPRLKLARDMAECGMVKAMMDISDGLGTDLAHLCEQSSVGARIHTDLLPVDKQLKNVALSLNRNFLAWVLGGGEDYQLLFTVQPENREQVEALSGQHGNLTRIGSIEGDPGVRMVTGTPGQEGFSETDISYSGFDHFNIMPDT